MAIDPFSSIPEYQEDLPLNEPLWLQRVAAGVTMFCLAGSACFVTYVIVCGLKLALEALLR